MRPADTPLSAGWWLLLVPACALPLFVALWEPADAGEIAGRVVGIACWTLVMARLHTWLVGRGEGRRAKVWLSSALGFGLLQAAGGLVSPLVLFVLYWPVVYVAGVFDVITDADWQPGVNLWLTLLSGAYVFLWVIVLTRLWLRFRPAPSPASVLTPAG